MLISDGLGPATFGFANVRIVVPRWLLDAPFELRALVLRHERQHVAAKDHWLLAAGLLIAVVAPWNAAVWWQLRRLRTAIAIDCDARVVRGGADAVAYSQALLAVRQRRAVSPLAAVALTEPVSQLERRIRMVLGAPRRLSRPAAAGTALIAAAFIAAACAVAPPETESTRARDTGDSAPGVHRQPITGMRFGSERAVILVDVSETMLDRTLEGVEGRRNETAQQQRQAPKWRQLVETVDGLLAQLRPGTQFQIIAYSADARSLIANSDGTWLDAGQPAVAEQAVQTLRSAMRPQGPSNLHAAFTAAARLQPAAETVYVVTDGLPNVPAAGGETSDDEDRRMSYFDLAINALPPAASVNVILLPMEDGPVSAPAYWALALRTGGSLLAPAGDGADGAIRGVSLGSDYLVFVVDTSGSMRQFAWDDIRNEMAETMGAYPSVKGIQVLSDQGEPMLRQFRNEWIPNTPAQRSVVLESLADWTAFSDSNPSKGILTAIESLPAQGEDVAIYVYGDDFASAPAINDFLNSVSDRNRLDAPGSRRARINAVAFPVYYRVTGDLMSAATYAALMRELSQRNGGSFIGLPVDADGR